MGEPETTNLLEVYEAGRQAGGALGEPRTLDGLEGRRRPLPFGVLPDGYHAESLEAFAGERTDRAAAATFLDVPSFLAYLEQFRTPTTLLLGDGNAGTVKALLDYHEPGPAGAAGTCLHTAVLALRKSDAWQAWTGICGKATPQQAFAEFLEDRLPEIVRPDGAHVLAAAKHLDSMKSVKFTSAVNLTNGLIQFKYEEEEKGQKALDMPSEFTLGIQPFETWDEEKRQPFRLEARLRYRINEQKLFFTVRLIRPEDVLKAAFRDVLKAVKDGAGAEVLLGSVTGVGQQ